MEGFSAAGLLAFASEVFNIRGQLLNVLQWYCVVIARSDAANAAVTLETLEQLSLGIFKERLLLRSISSADAKADIHPATDGSIGHNLVDLGMAIQDIINDFGFLVRQCFLTR